MAAILQESWCQLSPNCYRSARRNGKMAPRPILRIRRGHPPPHRHRTAIVETHNMKTLKPKNPLRSAVTAPLLLRISGNVPSSFSFIWGSTGVCVGTQGLGGRGREDFDEKRVGVRWWRRGGVWILGRGTPPKKKKKKQEACRPIQPAPHSNYSVLQQMPARGC